MKFERHPRLSTCAAAVAAMTLACVVPAKAQEPVVGGAARLAAWERHQEMAETSPFGQIAKGKHTFIFAPTGSEKTLAASM